VTFLIIWSMYLDLAETLVVIRVECQGPGQCCVWRWLICLYAPRRFYAGGPWPSPDGTAVLPTADLTTFTGHAVHAWSHKSSFSGQRKLQVFLEGGEAHRVDEVPGLDPSDDAVEGRPQDGQEGNWDGYLYRLRGAATHKTATFKTVFANAIPSVTCGI
jgi:hypothetical protein